MNYMKYPILLVLSTLFVLLVIGCSRTEITNPIVTTPTETTKQEIQVETSADAKRTSIPILDYPDSYDEYAELARAGKFLTNEEVVTIFDGPVIDGDNLVINDGIAFCPVAYKSCV